MQTTLSVTVVQTLLGDSFIFEEGKEDELVQGFVIFKDMAGR